MNCRFNGISPNGAPFPLSVRQTQARVRSVTTPSRIVAHALDLSPLHGPSTDPSALEGDRTGIKATVQQVLEQLWVNRLFWRQDIIDVENGEVNVGELDLAGLPTDDDDDIQQGRLEIKNGLYKMLLSQLGVNWFSWKNQNEGGIDVDGEKLVESADGSVGVTYANEGGPEENGDDGNNQQNDVDSPPPNIWRFLKPVPVSEVKMARVMASLSDLTYFVAKVSPAALFKRHKLNLVTTSLMFKEMSNKSEEIDEVMALGDGMAASEDFSTLDGQKVKSVGKAENNIVTATADEETLMEPGKGDGVMSKAGPATASTSPPRKTQQPMWLGTRTLASQMASQMAVTVGSAASGIYSHAMAQFARQLHHAMLFGQSAVNMTASQVINLVQAALALGNANPNQNEEDKTGKCPTEWFVCDHADSNTRIFCIQGSDNFESWQTNLSFDPVVFEDESLGVRVHRGVYSAAEGLYGLFAPLVLDHLKTSPKAKISMTGHSLGGSLSTVLMLMLVHRGVLPSESVGRVYTYGAAASFCEAMACGGSCGECGLSCPGHDVEGGGHTATGSILEKLNLDPECISNVVMHKDIVPRAFACDYSPVAALLRNVGSNFRAHGCLHRPRSLLYGFIGQVMVLQPDSSKAYVKEDYHPMLPEGAGLYQITDETEGLDEVLGWKRTAPVGEEVPNHREAVLSLMDNPHPLEILGDSKAYGESGTISRYHNPMHYKNALGSVLNISKQFEVQGGESTSSVKTASLRRASMLGVRVARRYLNGTTSAFSNTRSKSFLQRKYTRGVAITRRGHRHE
ncbi:hypothetical protein BSKO_12203 [Bryopsis sp. KO-2023]|nr:hypothetical protein BSKO_12203 [Bryopsis sp. KO-2023]